MKKRQRILVLMAVVTTVVTSARSLFADDTNTAPAATVDDKINRLEQEIQDLKQQREVDQQQAQQAAAQAAQQAKNAPIITAGPEGFRIRSADSNFVLRVGGYEQTDGRFYLHDLAGNGDNTFLVRRARLITEGTLFRDFDFRIMTDFGNGAAASSLLQDCYLEWRYWPWLKIRTGKFKPPVGLEQLQSDTDLLFVERGLPSDMVPQRDVGIQVAGDLLGGIVSYAGGVFDGIVDNGITDLDVNNSKDLAGRVFLQPFKTTDISPLEGLGFGAGGTIGDYKSNSTTTNLPTYKTTGQLTFFSYGKGVAPDGQQLRYTPQAYYHFGPLGVLAEYNVSEQVVRSGVNAANIDNNAWQVAGGFFLTGEDQRYRGSPYSPSGAVTPLHPFKPWGGGWGALELVVRYGDLRIDPDAFNKDPTATGARFASPITSAEEARDWGVGFNWYLNRNVKISLDYDYTTFEGGAGTATSTAYDIKNREAEQDLFTQAQFLF